MAAQPPNISGLIISQSVITSPELTTETFDKWYNSVHVPDMLATGAVSHAARWLRADAGSEEVVYPYLATCRVPNMDDIQSDAFQDIPMAHEMLPGGKSVHASADIDLSIYQLVDVHETEKHDEAFATHLITAGMTPKHQGASDDMERWYRDEHNAQMAREPGWVRSSRYKLVVQMKRDGSRAGEAPRWMTLHEFGEGNTLGTKVAPLEPVSDWTKKVMGNMASIEAYVWKRTQGWTK